MSPFIILAGATLVFFAGFLWRYPEAKENLLGNIILFILVTLLGLGFFFQEAVGNRILLQIDGKINQTDAESFIAQKYGVQSLYSWYAFEGFTPGIVIQTEKNGIQQQISIDAFSGAILSSRFPSVSDISFQDFQKIQKNIVIIQPSPSPIPLEDREPPKIEITFPADGQIFPAETKSVIVTAKVWDKIDKNPTLSGTGTFLLQKGFNSVIVTAQDASGNVGSAYKVVERK